MKKILLIIAFFITGIVFFYIGKYSQQERPGLRNTYNADYVYLSDTISSSHLVGDFDFYRKTLYSLHPALYKWHSKKEMDLLFDSVGRLLNKTMSRGGFYNLLSVINNRIACSHTDLFINKSIQGVGFFQLPIVCIANKYYSTCKDCNVPRGSRLLSINGRKMQDIANRLRIYESTDADNDFTSYTKITDDFPFKYFLAFGEEDSFDITFENPLTGEIQTATMDASAHGVSYIPLWHPFWHDDFAYDLKLDEKKNIAILKLRTFSFNSDNKQSAYENFIKNSFQLLSDVPACKNLVIDLRNNRGGDNKNCYLLYSYLAKKSFYEDSCSSMNSFSLPEENEIGGTSSTYIDSIKKIEYSFSQNPVCFSFIPSKAAKWEVSPVAFKGKIFVITNSATASASIRLSSLLQINDSAKVVGEQPDGIYWGSTAYFIKKYLLPHSGITFSVPLVSAKYNLFSHPYPLSAGLMPNHLVPLSKKDFLSGNDTQIDFIYNNLIKN